VPRRAPLAFALALAVAVLPVRAARPDELSVDPVATAAVAGGALAVWGVSALLKDELTPPTCRWCAPPSLDAGARARLRWTDPGAAGTLSDALVLALPASLLVWDHLRGGGDFQRTGEDALVVVEAVAFSSVATQVLKYATARRRPYALTSGRSGPDDDNSFPSGHASLAFASAAAFGTVAKLRGDAAWPFVYAAGFAGAAVVAYLRVAADKHWLTDVAAGAALGAAIGVATPLLLHRREDPARSPGVVVTPLPLGVAGVF
jgi:membrane-associated phospholipid phosphatase